MLPTPASASEPVATRRSTSQVAGRTRLGKARQSVTRGFTLIELLVVITILGILGSIAMYSFLRLQNPARDTAQNIVSVLTQAKTGAMSNTLAYRLVLNGTVVRLESAKSCDEPSAWTVLNSSVMTVPTGVSVTTTAPGGVIACYTPRGLASAAADVQVSDTRTHAFIVRSYYGGSIRVIRNG